MEIATPTYRLADPDMHFLASEKELYEYKHLYAFTNWLFLKLEDYPINEERPLLLLSRSSDQLIFTVAACWLLRIPFIPLSPEMTNHELRQLLKNIESPVAITDRANQDRLEDIPAFTIPADALMRKENSHTDRFSNQHPDKLIGYFHTSGSTGFPKKVPLKRRQMLFGAKASENNFKPDKNRYWLLCLPLNHIGGISIILRSLLYNTAIYRMSRFDAGMVSTFLMENKLFQVASLVPTMLKRLLDIKGFNVHLEFKAILLGGGPVTIPLLEKAVRQGIPIVSSYGMTETCAQIAANPLLKPSGTYSPKSSVGPLFKPNQIQIRNDDDTLLASNEPGNIWLRGPQVFDGYTDPELNKQRFDNEGWFKTGDIGYLNRYDHLFIQSRKKSRIITGGENVDPFEVESALENLDQVNEAAVIGVDDPEWGEKVIAFIVSSRESQIQDLLRDALKKKLSDFKIPKQFIVVDSIPRTESGKLHKRALQELYLEKYGHKT